jgi:hypothetical protein
MKTGNKTDLYDRIKLFQQRTLSNKPSVDEMINEVRMMNFKVRPVYGNISKLDFNNNAFIDALWSLGKLDEFFKDEVINIDDQDREVFFKLVDDMRVSLQQQLNRAHLVEKTPKEEAVFFEIEIFKDNISQIN